jgi:hypothetical protein
MEGQGEHIESALTLHSHRQRRHAGTVGQCKTGLMHRSKRFSLRSVLSRSGILSHRVGATPWTGPAGHRCLADQAEVAVVDLRPCSSRAEMVGRVLTAAPETLLVENLALILHPDRLGDVALVTPLLDMQ